MRTKEQITETVKAIVVDQLAMGDEASVTMESRFLEDLGADSLDLVELVMAMEEEFDIITVDADEEARLLRECLTVGDAVNEVCKALKVTA